MSYLAETDHKHLDDVKRRRSLCSTDECMSPIQQNLFSEKHLSEQIANSNRLTNKKHSRQNISSKKRPKMRKQSQINRWSTSSKTQLSTNSSNMNIKQIFTKFQHQFEQNLPDETFSPNTYSNIPIDDDVKSESSIEYDYTNPLPITIINPIPYRHVSIATIYLQDEQWHQLELFIKHFSSYASLSNNMNINSSTTHLLVDDSSMPLRCTFSKKIFQAVARRISIVSIRWIEECLLQNEIIDETRFEIHGDSTMSIMHLARHSTTIPLFPSSVSFAIDCTSFQRTLTRNELAELAVLSGATLFDPEEQTSITHQAKILLVLADPTTDRFRLENKYKQWHKDIRFLTPGFLLKSIVYQEQQPFEDFEL